MTTLRRSVAALVTLTSNVPAIRQAVGDLFTLHRDICFAHGWPAPSDEPYFAMCAVRDATHHEVRKAFQQLLVLSELSHADEITARVRFELSSRYFVYGGHVG